ncbi:Uma2 family endonuclease [Spirulina subsalsa]|uniref:Uma2 family endonuclease n=1 Tax=Spirulina subsalsa TaxID=54311 RepID=UPI00030705F5|nr:Uma2 family endonuclease [Spirulina subsalsa]
MLTLTHPPDTLTLQWPTDLKLNVTPAQFAQLAIANPELKLERTATGELIVNPPTGGETGHRNIRIAYFLVKWMEEEGGHGIAFDSSTGFILPNGANRSPDAAWIRLDRWQTLTPVQRRGFVPLCPDFVIELRSESDSLSKLQDKLQEYIDNGTQLGWLIDPQQEQVEIYRPGQEVEILPNSRQLSGENVLPGFVLDWQHIISNQ